MLTIISYIAFMIGALGISLGTYVFLNKVVKLI